MSFRLLFFCLAFVSSAHSQVKDSVNEIACLNLKGNFFQYHNMYQDSVGRLYGIRQVRRCAVFTTVLVGMEAISKGTAIAELEREAQVIKLFYNDAIRYVKFKKGDFTDFMTENTIDGKLKPPASITFKGKRMKVYCERDQRTLKLRQRCD